MVEIIKEAYSCFGDEKPGAGIEPLELSRILHTLGSAILKFMPKDSRARNKLLRRVGEFVSEAEKRWLDSLGLKFDHFRDAMSWAQATQEAAFENVSRTIVFSKDKPQGYPKNALRTDEIIWGRAPARLDLGGGWSDTPSYSLEHGGSVINAAVNLNGQPPIHAYARVIDKPEIRISSIDLGAQITIRELGELLDYRMPTSQFGLAKATLALAGFSRDAAKWPPGVNTLEEMMKRFGGGIELTTLAAIPSGSGLGTSSIMGAVLMAVVHRLIGRELSARQLFHNVLRLEQELTTGGGWQDQVGGAVGGVKMITSEPGIVPDPRIHYVPPDVLDPRLNGGQTLLYYTGIRRLAKNILHYVVGHYLDRDRAAMETLRNLHAFPPMMVEAMAAKDIRRFGELIDVAWNLNKRIDPDSTTDVIERILGRIKRHIYGAKLLGAGGGGFLLMICRSLEDAAAVRRLLTKAPPNERARFFDFEISSEGLAVTVS
jgi:galactokinase/mevalonate kinase-like predicted kinase